MLIGICYFHGLECARSDMQCDFGSLYAALAQSSEYFVGKVQARSRCCYRTFDARIDSLVGGLVAFLCLAVEVWWNRQLTYSIEDFGETGEGIGYWRLAIGYWRLAIGYWRWGIGYW